MFNFDHTLSEIIVIKNEITLITRIVAYLSQCVMLGLYTYNIVIYHDVVPKLIIYIILLVLTFSYLVFSAVIDLLSAHKDKERKKKLMKLKKGTVRHVIITMKYTVNLAGLILSTYYLITLGSSDAGKLVLIGAYAAFLISVAAELIRYLFNRYLSILSVAIKLDCKENIVGEFTARKGYDINEVYKIEKENEKYLPRINEDVEEYRSTHVKNTAEVKNADVIKGMVKDIAKDTIKEKFQSIFRRKK